VFINNQSYIIAKA